MGLGMSKYAWGEAKIVPGYKDDMPVLIYNMYQESKWACQLICIFVSGEAYNRSWVLSPKHAFELAGTGWESQVLFNFL